MAIELKHLVEVKELKKYFPVDARSFFKKEFSYVRAVDNISFYINQGETLGLVGESGSGKSTTGRTMLKLMEPTSGDIFFDGTNISVLPPKNMRLFRKKMQIVFQDPYASLNPRMTIGEIIGEPLLLHDKLNHKEREEKTKYLLQLVGLDPNYMNRYPHEFSGGQRQRIGIARAIILDPKFIVCDEPVSALDVSIQAQIINLFQELKERLKLTYLFIAHDLAVVRHISNRIAVMYLGRIVELADSRTLYQEPLHPYTQALLSSVPIPDPTKRKSSQIILKGEPPSPSNPPSGCHFHPRCPLADKDCKVIEPKLEEKKPGHFAACIKV